MEQHRDAPHGATPMSENHEETRRSAKEFLFSMFRLLRIGYCTCVLGLPPRREGVFHVYRCSNNHRAGFTAPERDLATIYIQDGSVGPGH